MSDGRASFTSSYVRNPFCLPTEMRRSSSSSFGSSLMRLNSLRTLGSRGMRVVDYAIDRLRAAARELVDAGAVALDGVQLAVECGGSIPGLGESDGPAEL